MRKGPSARDLSQQLAARAEQLARELLPAGHREGSEWVAPSLAGTSPRAMSVRLTGGKAGAWGCFDSFERGDSLDLVAFVLFRGDRKRAYAWTLRYLGITPGTGPAPVPRPAPAPRLDGSDPHDAATRAAALRLFLSGQAEIRDTPVDRYLKARGIDLAELGRQPRSLRYMARCRCTEIDGELPAMLAAICGPDGTHIATHRTYLQEIDGTVRKAQLRAPKKALGRYTGGTIRLWKGASGRPLAAVSELETVAVGEGIETCLSVAIACPHLRVLSAISLPNLGQIVLPQRAVDLVILADNDTNNPAAQAALDRAVNRLMLQGRSVRIARASGGAKDFNDILKENANAVAA